MHQSKICLSLTGSTLEENIKTVEKYRNYIDLVDLRADYLTTDERLYIRKFPNLIDVPCILSIRRKIDGGLYDEGEVTRTVLFARALAFMSSETGKKFAFVDLEEDFNVSCLHDAAIAFGTKIIRSYYNIQGTVVDIDEHIQRLRRTKFEIPKITCTPQSLQELTSIFSQTEKLAHKEMIINPIGQFSLPSRLLASKFHSFITYTAATTKINHDDLDKEIDPITLFESYQFDSIDTQTNLYGTTGFPLDTTKSPLFHNKKYKSKDLKNVYISLPSTDIKESLDFAELLGIKGLTILSPFKKDVLDYVSAVSPECEDVGVCNLVLYKNGRWIGYNTEGKGFIETLTKFLGIHNLRGSRVAIIGAGGAGYAAAYAVKMLKGKACIFNRTVGSAKMLADKYRFAWSALGDEDEQLLRKYSDLIIQTTTVGTNHTNTEEDPIPFYHFTGKEILFETIYNHTETALMKRANAAGCRTQNGTFLLARQSEYQFQLFTGRAPQGKPTL
ncbi:MAG: type I 3-dehydroquinate dehydratase [Treponemataceae bacterium]